MAKQLFLNDMIDDNMDASNPYTDYFMDSIGKGPGRYYSGIGQVYKASSRYQRGYGYLGQMYRPPTFRHGGSGIGSALMSMFRFAMPLIKRGVRKLGTEAVDVASKIATDAIHGKDIAESAKQHASEKVSEVMKQVPEALSAAMTNKSPVVAETGSLSSRPLKRRRVYGSRYRPRSVGGKRRRQARYPGLDF